MKMKKIYTALAIGFMSFLTINESNTYADAKAINKISKEGKYVIEDAYQYDEEDYDNCEVAYTPSKTGVYKFKVTVHDKCDSVCMTVFDINSETDYYSVTAVDGKGKKEVVAERSIYLESNRSYYVPVYIAGNNKIKNFDFEVAYEKDAKLNPPIKAYFVSDSSKKKLFNKYKKKGFTWNQDANTLTLDNCNLKGYISYEVDYDKVGFDYDRDRFFPTLTIDVKGNSSIKTKENDIFDGSYVHFVIKGEGKDKSVLKVSDFTSGMTESSITIEDIKLETDKLSIWGEPTYIKNSIIKGKATWDELGPDDDFGGERGYESEEEYNKWLCEYNYVFWGPTYIDDSELEIELELLPAAYIGRNIKKTLVKGVVIYNLQEYKNSKISFTGCREAIKFLKNGKIKVARKDYKDLKYELENISYKTIMTYRNGAKKGSIISGEKKYSKKYKNSLVSDDYTYRVVKTASTDGVKMGKVYVVDYSGKKSKATKIVIGDKIYSHGCEYKVVGIDKKAFAKMTKLNKVVIKAKSLKKIGKKAFARKGGKKITFVVPKGKKKKYTRLLKRAKVKNFIVK
ncbi:hypothetical protein [Eubacterium sp.]|uniref:hypothetical protein n=1 Tax=Eubacterium sp. TaxID=142586 RepID=UPI0025DC4B70|nr:hypothetical protein [Eubacterium sp.]MCR5629018.1 hypothetical protein [Eubacterium sp.]